MTDIDALRGAMRARIYADENQLVPQLIEATGLFETERRGNHLFLRDRRAAHRRGG